MMRIAISPSQPGIGGEFGGGDASRDRDRLQIHHSVKLPSRCLEGPRVLSPPPTGGTCGRQNGYSPRFRRNTTWAVLGV